MSNGDAGIMNEGVLRRLSALEGAEAIRALKARYAEAVDRCIEAPSAESAAAVADLFLEDGVGDFGQFGRHQGRAALIELFGSTLASLSSWSRHFMMNPIIEVDGESATGRWYAIAQIVFKSNAAAGPQPTWVRYEDTYAKTEKGWKLRSVIVHFDTPPAAG